MSADIIVRLGLRGDGAIIAERAFAEAPEGAAAAAERALERGKNPAGLFLQMVRQGDHLESVTEWAPTVEWPPSPTVDESIIHEPFVSRVDELIAMVEAADPERAEYWRRRLHR